MTLDSISLICLTLLGLAALVGIFKTKRPGWGRYTTNLLVLVIAILTATALLITGKLGSPAFTNILLTIVGYASGLVAGKATMD